jgi:hypothetical protein
LVKGLQVLDRLIRLPSVIPRCPSNIKFDGFAGEPMANYLVHQPFLVVWHPEVVEAFALATRE